MFSHSVRYCSSVLPAPEDDEVKGFLEKRQISFRMACGTPVLGTPVGASPEVIGAFDKRLLFEGKDWPHLKNKLEDLVQRPKDNRFEPEACRSYVEGNFSWERVAEAFKREVGDL